MISKLFVGFSKALYELFATATLIKQNFRQVLCLKCNEDLVEKLFVQKLNFNEHEKSIKELARLIIDDFNRKSAQSKVQLFQAMLMSLKEPPKLTH